MIDCYLLDGHIYHEKIRYCNFKYIIENTTCNLELLNSIPSEVIILILDEYSRKLSRNKNMLKIEGVAYLSFFLRKANIEKLIELNIGNKKYLDDFVDKGKGKFVKAQGRGISCHWVAGNVYTLAIYSVVQSIIAKNFNIARIPEQSLQMVLKLLECMENIEVNYMGKSYSSIDILKNICIIYFNSKDEDLNREMSHIADSRIVWGGQYAVEHISLLPKKTTCKDIIFGSKYSFAVFDSDILECDSCEKYMDRLVLDIVLFGQKACSSPQVLFVEKSNKTLNYIVKMLESSFEKIGVKHKNILDEGQCTKIINERGFYSLSLDKDICCSRGMEYTILINNDIKLEEPVGGRCIFVKEIDSIFNLEALITRRIQTVGFAIKDENKIFKFADLVTKAGVDRVINIGNMNDYDCPWDGYLMINELVRWCNLNMNF
jgi:hypothetical protein